MRPLQLELILMKRNTLRINDRVVIIRPHVFLGCHYPLTKEIVKKTLITDQEKQKICDLVGLNRSFLQDMISGNDYVTEHAYEEILDALAYLKLKKVGYGGTERRIFTQHKPELLNQTGHIIARKVVNTGFYHHGWTSYEGDCEPPFLSNMKAHVIFTVSLDSAGWNSSGDRTIEIEKTNLEKITDDISSKSSR
jgi:hypothetical protein